MSTITQNILNKLNRKVSRQEELSAGQRVSFNRVYKDKKKYDRKVEKRNRQPFLVD